MRHLWARALGDFDDLVGIVCGGGSLLATFGAGSCEPLDAIAVSPAVANWGASGETGSVDSAAGVAAEAIVPRADSST